MIEVRLLCHLIDSIVDLMVLMVIRGENWFHFANHLLPILEVEVKSWKRLISYHGCLKSGIQANSYLPHFHSKEG